MFSSIYSGASVLMLQFNDSFNLFFCDFSVWLLALVFGNWTFIATRAISIEIYTLPHVAAEHQDVLGVTVAAFYSL